MLSTIVAPDRPLAKYLSVWSVASAVACAAIVATSPARAQETAAEAPTAAAPVGTSATTEAPAGGSDGVAEQPRKIHEVIAAADPLVQEFNEHLTVLASPWMEGRLPGTRGMERAMQYMEDQFARAGLEPGFQPSDGGPKNYRQPFPLGSSREVKL